MTRAVHQAPGDAAGIRPDFVVADRIVKHFPVRLGAWRKGSVRSLDGVSFGIRQGEVLGLVGESGCGKTTLARVLLRLLPPDSGSVTIAGRDLSSLHGEELRRFRTSIQLIFQNPYAALDPRMRVGTSLEAPLAQHGRGTHQQRRQHVIDMLRLVGLDDSFVERLPSQCSGGELQRIVIARALLLEPSFLVCDEPTSALDPGAAEEAIDLFLAAATEDGVGVVLASHNVALMQRAGAEIVEVVFEDGWRRGREPDESSGSTESLADASRRSRPVRAENTKHRDGGGSEPPPPRTAGAKHREAAPDRWVSRVERAP